MTKPWRFLDDHFRKPPAAEIPPDFPITKLPAGEAAGARPSRWNAQRQSTDARKPMQLSIQCAECGESTTVKITRKQLKNVRAKCQKCGASLSFCWQKNGVKSK